MTTVNAGRLEQTNDGVRLILTENGGTLPIVGLCSHAETARWYTHVLYPLHALRDNRLRSPLVPC